MDWQNPQVQLLLALCALVGVALVVVLALLRGERRRRWALQVEAEASLQSHQTELAALRDRNTEFQVSLSAAQARLTRIEALERDLRLRDGLIEQLREERARLRTDLETQQARMEAERENNDEKLRLLQQAREQMQAEFGQLARKIFEDNSQRFGNQQQEKLDHVLRPLRDQLGDFRRRVDDVYDRESKDRAGLKEQILQLKQLNLRMSQDALNLTNALKGESKTQGNWGEIVLERVLEESGLRRGYEYEVQFSARTEEGRRFQPDVVIHLPEQKDLVVDAKVSLVAYERYCSAADEEQAQAALKEHVGSLRRHIRGLSDKAYQDLPGVRTLDFVLLFVPIEAAFMVAIEQDRELFGEAFERNILLVSPSTLLVTLRTINNIWRYEKQNVHAQEIARQGAELYDKFVGFVESLEEVGRHLGQTHRAYELAHKRLSSGKGNLVNRVSALKALGVAGRKKLASELVETAAADQDDG